MRTRLCYPVLLTTIAAFALRGACLAENAGKPKRPVNILFLFTDDQRWDTIGALGNPSIKTPVLDKLVDEGYKFDNTYCMGAWCPAVCLPSRIMVMTGRTMWRIPRRRKEATDLATIPSVLKKAGYATFRSGKAGNVYDYANGQFDENTSNDNRGPFSSKEHADRAIDFLRRHDSARPFYVHVAFAKPHDPRLAPPRYMQMYDRGKLPLPPNFLPRHPFDNGELYIRDEMLAPFPRTPEVMRQHLGDYYACITYLDVQCGRILDALKQRGLADNTVVVFSSDQGLAVGGQHGLMGKQNLYECNKPPLIFAGPGIPRGRSDALVYLYDLLPTFCDLAGIEIPPTVEGKSILPIINGRKEKVRDWTFGAYMSCQRMIRDGRFKLMKHHAGGKKNIQLFDLQNDPHEMKNLADDPRYATDRGRLENLLLEARQWAGDPIDFEGQGGPPSSARLPRKEREQAKRSP